MVDPRRPGALMVVALLFAAGCGAGSGQLADPATTPSTETATPSLTATEDPTSSTTAPSDPAASSSSTTVYSVPVIDDLAIGDDLTDRLGLQPLRFYNALRGDDLAEVEKVRLFLLENPTVELDIRVHVGQWQYTDDETTLAASQGPAREIFLHLNNHGIAENRIVATGRGRTEPRMFPKDPSGGQTREEFEANNRVEFFVTAL